MRPVVAALLAAMTMIAGCGDDDGPSSPVSPSDISMVALRDLVTGVTAVGIEAAARPGLAPPAGGGPAAAVAGNQTVVNGGTLAAAVSATVPFQTIYIFVGSQTAGVATAAEGGVDGYYELRLPSPQTATSAILALAQSIPVDQMDLRFAVADLNGAVGPYARLSTTVASVGTGDVQVTLSWDADSDVDVHVVDPAGEEVYYGNRRSASGGELDLDSNAGCSIDGVRNENITWPVGRAPRGTYTVRVDYWSSCGVPSTNYTVRVNAGGNVQIFSGSFTGAGDQGGRGSGRLITTFDRLTGPTAGPPSSGATSSGASSKTLVVPQR